MQTALHATPNRLLANASALSDLFKNEEFAFKLVSNICAPVARLFTRGCPTAIGRLVIPIYINTVEAVGIGWGVPNVGKEVLEATVPPVTDFNTPSPITRIARFVGITAPLPHAGPSVPNLGFAKPVSISGLLDCFCGATAARRRAALLAKVALGYVERGAAIASTTPITASIFSENRKSRQASEALTGNVAGTCHAK